MIDGVITNAMRPVHPGEVLREEFLVPLEMSANALSIRLRVPAPRVNDLVRPDFSITHRSSGSIFKPHTI